MTDMRSLMNIISETALDEMAGAGPARIVHHIRDGVPFVMMSAMRADLPASANKRRTEMLKSKLASLPVSFIVTGGEYHEVGQEEPSEEISFFIMPKDPSKRDALRNFGYELTKAFDQDSMVYGDGEEIHLVFNDGSDMSLGNAASFDPEVVKKAEGFSKIKQRRFTFTNRSETPKATQYGADHAVAKSS